MKFIIVIIVGLLLGGAIAYFGSDASNTISFNIAGYTGDIPVLHVIVGLTAILLLVYIVFWLLNLVITSPKKLRTWRQKKSEENAQTSTMRGFAQLIEGNWDAAEDALLNKIQHNKSALINYLGLAYSAQQRGMVNRRDLYLQDARKKFPKQSFAIDLTHARLNYQAGQYDAAQGKLEDLRKQAPKNLTAVRLLADVYERTENWNALVGLFPVAKKLKALPEAELAHKERLAYQHVLEHGALTVDGQGDAKDPWLSLPGKVKKNPHAILGQAQQLLSDDKHAEAEKLVRKALNRGYDSELAYLYGNINTNFTSDQLKLVASWLKKQPDSVELALSEARLNFRAENYDLAQEQLQKIIAGNNHLSGEACHDLGKLLEQIGEKDAALLCYKRGLEGSVGLEADSDETVFLEKHQEDDTIATDSDLVPLPGADVANNTR